MSMHDQVPTAEQVIDYYYPPQSHMLAQRYEPSRVYTISILAINEEIEDNATQVSHLLRVIKFTQNDDLASFLSGLVALRKQYHRDLMSLMDMRRRMIEAGF